MRRSTKGRTEKFRKVDLLAGADSLPVHAEVKGSVWVGAGTIMAGLFLGGVLVRSIFLGPMRDWMGIVLFVCFIAFVVWTAVLCGIKELMLHRAWDVTANGVECREREIRVWKEWSEPLSAYEGVLARQELLPVGKRMRVVYSIELVHRSDDAKSVMLYSSVAPEGLRASQERAARLFNLPALTVSAAGIEKRQAEDLDKSVRERVAEAGLPVTFDPASKPPGKSLTVRVDGDALVLSAPGRSLIVRHGWVFPALILGGGAIGAAGLLEPEQPTTLALMVGSLSILAGVGALVFFLLLKEELVVSSTEVRKRWRHPWGGFFEAAVPAEEIEDVIIQTPPDGQGMATVQVISDSPVLQFGVGLPKVDKEWVRDCVIAVISK
jgi:hypothetical protein